MKKNLSVLRNKEQAQNAIDKLDRNKIHVLYFSHYFNFYNFYHNPLLIATKILNFANRKPSIDHVAHVCRFIFDKENNNWVSKVFEATMARGMEENDLFDKLKSFRGICYIETLDKTVDKVKAKAFETYFNGVVYSAKLALLSGIDGKFDSIPAEKTNGSFCSSLEALFLIDQGVDLSKIEKGKALEITPTDLFLANLGEKKILYRD